MFELRKGDGTIKDKTKRPEKETNCVVLKMNAQMNIQMQKGNSCFGSSPVPCSNIT